MAKIRKEKAAAATSGAASIRLLADLRAVLLWKVKIAERTMKVHAGAEHVRIDDKNLFATWTSDLYSLTHRSS
jgi:hypothetical protein